MNNVLNLVLNGEIYVKLPRKPAESAISSRVLGRQKWCVCPLRLMTELSCRTAHIETISGSNVIFSPSGVEANGSLAVP